jgi:hypothetical protein
MSLFWIVYCISAIGLVLGVLFLFHQIVTKEKKDITLHPTLIACFLVLCPVLNFIILIVLIVVLAIEYSNDITLFKGKE